MANRFERGKLPPYTIPTSFNRLGTRIIGINEIVGGESPPDYQVPAGTLIWDYTLTERTSADNLLPINGEAVSRTQYPDLFSALGTTYGAGDGSTTFNVPSCFNLYSRVLGPATGARGTYSRAILPLHNHAITTPANSAATLYTAVPNADGVYLNPGGINALSWNTGDVGPFRSDLQPTVSTRFTGYITTTAYSLQIGQIIYGLSDDLLNYVSGKFLKCNGASFNPSIYGKLASTLSSTSTPNLRGRFPVVRPFTPGSRSANFGSTTLPTHSHSSPVAFTGLRKAGLFYPPSPARSNAVTATSPGSNTQPISSTVISSTYTLGPGADNRPANVSLEFLMCAL